MGVGLGMARLGCCLCMHAGRPCDHLPLSLMSACACVQGGDTTQKASHAHDGTLVVSKMTAAPTTHHGGMQARACDEDGYFIRAEATKDKAWQLPPRA